MKTIEVTDEQYAFVQRLREEISREVVGKYGYVRDRDAVQFLIDNLDEEFDVDVDFDASEGVAASVDATVEDGSDDRESVSYTESAGASDDATEPEVTDEDGAEMDDDEAETPDNGDEPATAAGNADDDDMLDRMMNLLETHDDKWEESPSADYRYRVTLPDGTTEDVQTKDDVRALLFQNY